MSHLAGEHFKEELYEGAANTDVVIPFTYSSARTIDERIVPSRLSMMSFDAAADYAKECLVFDNPAQVVIAGEQSYSEPLTTTGEALQSWQTAISNDRLTLLSHYGNRLLNTVLQVDRLAGWLYDKDIVDDIDRVTVVAFDFHMPRIQQAFRWQNLQPRFVAVDDINDERWKYDTVWELNFQEHYGLQVDWPDIKERALRTFKRREYYTRLAQTPFWGAGLRMYSIATGNGRYDDIAPDGTAIRKSTR